jgi:hypothetical protein
MKYKDLNLKKIREDNDLDFAHFTYQKGMCSCCYGPKDLPKKYWKDGVIPEHDNYTYLLFKNADNGSGHVKRDDDIDELTYIEWDFPEEKLESVCRDLQKQFSDEYVVLVPKSTAFCIVVDKANSGRIERHVESGNYYILNN